MMTTKPPYADKVKEVTYEEAKLLRSLGVNVGADWKCVVADDWVPTTSEYMHSDHRWHHIKSCLGADYDLFFFVDKDDDYGQA